jgi:lipoate-protein ligase A
MPEIWRVVDTGLRPAAQNIALNRALLEARQAGEIPSTLRFLRFAPCMLLGCDQSAEQELNLDYCGANHIAVQRRITGGAASYLDENQIGWELYLHRHDIGAAALRVVSRRICHAAATAISALGMDARCRSCDDIEIGGREISRVYGASDGDALLFQGTLLVDLEVEKMLRALRVSAEIHFDQAVTAVRERFASLRELLGRNPDMTLVKRYLMEAFESEFDIEFTEGDLTLSEHARYQGALREIDTPGWVHLVARPRSEMPILEAAQGFRGGALRATVTLDTTTQTIRQVWFSGITVNPQRTLADLEAALRDQPINRLAQKIEWFFANRPAAMGTLTAADFIMVVQRAIKQPLLIKK